MGKKSINRCLRPPRAGGASPDKPQTTVGSFRELETDGRKHHAVGYSITPDTLRHCVSRRLAPCCIS
jgi:hypothetical protein